MFCRCTEEDGTLKVSEVKSGPLMKSDLDSSVSLPFLSTFSVGPVAWTYNRWGKYFICFCTIIHIFLPHPPLNLAFHSSTVSSVFFLWEIVQNDPQSVDVSLHKNSDK